MSAKASHRKKRLEAVPLLKATLFYVHFNVTRRFEERKSHQGFCKPAPKYQKNSLFEVRKHVDERRRLKKIACLIWILEMERIWRLST